MLDTGLVIHTQDYLNRHNYCVILKNLCNVRLGKLMPSSYLVSHIIVNTWPRDAGSLFKLTDHYIAKTERYHVMAYIAAT